MFKVRVIDENGNAVWIETRGDERIRDFRRKVWQKTGVPWSTYSKCQVLSLCGREFPPDHQTINPAIGLENGDVVQIFDDKTALMYGFNYLHVAANEAVEEAVRILIERGSGSELDAKDNHNYTPLHISSSQVVGNLERIKMVEYLVGAGANCDAVNSYGNTPLHDAVHNGCEKAIFALECGGADTDCADKEGKRPLHVAASNEPSALHAQALLEMGASTHNGSTPLDFSVIIHCNPQFTEILLMVGVEE